MSRCSDKLTKCISVVIVSAAGVYAALNTSDKGDLEFCTSIFLVIRALLLNKRNSTMPEPFIMHIVGQAFPNLFFQNHLKISEDLGVQKII
jgi:hypothetical protein